MGFLDKIFGKGKNQPVVAREHAVLVYFRYGSTDLSSLFDLEDQLRHAINAAEAGELDGNEVATDGGEGVLHMYGPDADALFAAVRPTLEAAAFMKAARVKLRYGAPTDGVKEAEVVLGT